MPIQDSFVEVLKNCIQVGLYVLGGKKYLSKYEFESKYKSFFKRLNENCVTNQVTEIKYRPPHTTRHTYASMLVKSGINIKLIQLLLGHANIEMTSLYSHADVEDLRKAVNEISFL